MVKYFRFTFDYAMYEISYANLMMLLGTIPVFDNDKETTTEPGGSDAGDFIEVETAADFMKLGVK